MSSPDATVAADRRPALRNAAFLIGALLAVAAAARAGIDIDALLAAAFVAVLVASAVVDLEERRIPNRLILPAAAVALVAQGILHGDLFVESVLAGFGSALFFLAAKLVSSNAVGMGDVKLVLLIGLVLGKDVVTALLVTSVAGAIAGLVLIAGGGFAARKQAIPFAPFLAAGAVAALLIGTPPLYS